MKSTTSTQSERTWHIIDAKGRILGRFATEAATLLRGKQKPTFETYLDSGDHVVIINAAKLLLSGNKLEDKVYQHHTNHPGGLRTRSVKDVLATKPEEVVIAAVKGMLPKNKLQNLWMKRLHVYAGEEHPHQANVAAK